MSSIQSVWRFVMAAVLVAVIPLTAPVSAFAQDTYAAIAFSVETGSRGFGYQFDSQKKAEKEALAQCRGDDAKIVVWVKNGWCALAVGDNNKYGFGHADDRDTAQNRAIAECRKRTSFTNWKSKEGLAEPPPGVRRGYCLAVRSTPINDRAAFMTLAPAPDGETASDSREEKTTSAQRIPKPDGDPVDVSDAPTPADPKKAALILTRGYRSERLRGTFRAEWMQISSKSGRNTPFWGARIVQLDPDSPLHELDLQVNDVVTRLDGLPIATGMTRRDPSAPWKLVQMENHFGPTKVRHIFHRTTEVQETTVDLGARTRTRTRAPLDP